MLKSQIAKMMNSTGLYLVLVLGLIGISNSSGVNKLNLESFAPPSTSIGSGDGPQVQLLVDTSTPIKEDEERNVVLKCSVVSEPDATTEEARLKEVRWYLHGIQLKWDSKYEENTRISELNIKTQVQVSGDPSDPSKLLLEKVGRKFQGDYACEGRKAGGVWGPRSTPVYLDVQYGPECRLTAKEVGNEKMVICEVTDGNPPLVDFKWILDNETYTGEVITKGWTSVTFPKSPVHGEYQCFVNNSMGDTSCRPFYDRDQTRLQEEKSEPLSECSEYVKKDGWIPIESAWNADLLLFGMDNSRKLFPCRAEYNGRFYFGKGFLGKVITATGGLDPPLNPSCWVADGPFEAYFKSGFSVLKKPPGDYFSLKWKSNNVYDQNSSWTQVKDYLLSEGALNVDYTGEGVFMGRCRDLMEMTPTPNPSGRNLFRRKRFIPHEQFEETQDENYQYVGYLEQRNDGVVHIPFGGVVGTCDQAEFLTCNPIRTNVTNALLKRLQIIASDIFS